MLELNLELKLQMSLKGLSFKVWYFHGFHSLQACLELMNLYKTLGQGILGMGLFHQVILGVSRSL